MPVLGTYQRVVIQGLGPGSEIWQTGFNTETVTPFSTQADLQAFSNTIEPFVNTWWTTVKSKCYALYKYTGITVYQYVAPSTTAQFQAATSRAPVAGTVATGGAAIDNACVVSIRSAVPGRSNRGRMYTPFHLPINSTDGMMNSADVAQVGTATKALFTAISGGSTAVPVVVSRTKNTYQPVSSLVTDNKPDVQRRRENRLGAAVVQVLPFP